MSGGESVDRLRQAADVIYAGIKTVPHIAGRRALADRLAADVLAALGPDNAADAAAHAQRNQLGQALGEVLVAAGVLHGEWPLSGPELLMAARGYVEHLATAAPRNDCAAKFGDAHHAEPDDCLDDCGCECHS